MRFSPAHLFGCRRAVNTVAGTVQSNPCEADWTIRPWRKPQFTAELSPFYGFRENGRIERVVRVRNDHGHMQFSDRASGTRDA